MVNVPVSATAEVTEFTPGVANDAATEENITIKGQISRPDGNPAANEFVLVFIGYGEANSGFDDPKTDTNGEFSISVPADKETVLAFEQVAFDRDGVPDLYTLASVNSSSDIDLGETVLPAAHVLNVTVVNSTGAPVKNASVNIGHRNDGRRIGTIDETNEEGQFEIGPSPPGYEVVGDVSVRVTPPDSNQVVAERSLSVTEDRDITITIDVAAPESPLELVQQDGNIGFQEVLGVIQGFNADQTYTQDGQTVTVGFQDVLEVIQEFNAQQ
jgi:hypothetical protein